MLTAIIIRKGLAVVSIFSSEEKHKYFIGNKSNWQYHCTVMKIINVGDEIKFRWTTNGTNINENTKKHYKGTT